ncbi:MAG: heme exporter protein CcmD [Hyphomicrobiales bacterium]|nr:MAG: heme exporter protein CcmD [Hyphomicrobiales bacterium]
MFGEHAAFIIPSYAVSALVIIAMCVRIMLQYKAQQREIARLEKAGIKRRSAK